MYHALFSSLSKLNLTFLVLGRAPQSYNFRSTDEVYSKWRSSINILLSPAFVWNLTIYILLCDHNTYHNKHNVAETRCCVIAVTYSFNHSSYYTFWWCMTHFTRLVLNWIASCSSSQSARHKIDKRLHITVFSSLNSTTNTKEYFITS